MTAALDQLLQNPAIWRIGHIGHIGRQAEARAGIGSGFAQLDNELPDRGWPVGALTELLCDEEGIGELSLLSPALRRLTHEGRGIVLIAPARLPFARAWEARGIKLEQLMIVEAEGNELVWCADQALRSGSCGMVVVWGQGVALDYSTLRRFQLAAETGNTACVLYRALRAEASPSAAPLRIALSAGAGELVARIVKRRGMTRSASIRLGVFPSHWDRQYSETVCRSGTQCPTSDAGTETSGTRTCQTYAAAHPLRLLRSVSH